jgi:hypothetical protein
VIARTIPIAAVKATQRDALRMAVAAIENFLLLYGRFSEEELAETDAGKIVAGRWYSRVSGFHDDDDFLHLTRDMLLYLQSGDARSQVSDQLAYFFSGFMPSYGAACALLKIVGESGQWSDVQAFMHAHGYGNARAYVEGFDWKGGEQKAKAEVRAWAAILKEEIDLVEAQRAGPPVQVAFAGPGLPWLPQAPATATPPVTVPTVPAAGQAARAARALPWLAEVAGPALFVLFLVVAPRNLGPSPELEWERRREEELKKERLLLQDAAEQAVVAVNATNNECRPQREINQQNGAKCENDGYTLMEEALKYQRLVDPPKGRGLDGLFEKLAPHDQPAPMPSMVTVPRPGRLVFVPEQARPPQSRYDYTGKPPVVMYPKFVVFEAKNIEVRYEHDDEDGIKKKSKERLKNTCDGQQMSEPWTEKRIPQALERQNPGAKHRSSRTQKKEEILLTGYARWIFVCLPGPIGGAAKLYVFIDVEASEMDLESMKPRARKSSEPVPDSGY